MTTTTKPKDDEAPEVPAEDAPQTYPDEAKRLEDLEAQREAEKERNRNFIDPDEEEAKKQAAVAQSAAVAELARSEQAIASGVEKPDAVPDADVASDADKDDSKAKSK